MTIKEIKKAIKGVFKLPKAKYYLGIQKHGTPYFYPLHYVRSIVRVRKLKPKTDKDYNDYIKRNPYCKGKLDSLYYNLPIVRRSWNKIVHLFKTPYYVEWGWPVAIHRGHLGWKDKHMSPRYEWSPSFHIFFFGLQFCIWWVPPVNDGLYDNYWECLLWYLHYSDRDLTKAKETWPWRDRNDNSTWNDEYLLTK